MPAAPEARHRGESDGVAALLVIAAGVVAALHVGKLPPGIPVLRAELGLTLVQGGFLLPVMQMAGMTLGILAGLLADRAGLRRTMLLGLCLLTLGSAAGASAGSVSLLLAARMVEGVGLLLTVLPGPGLLRRLVLVMVFSGVGGLIPGTLFGLAVRLAPSAQTVSTTVGWVQQLSSLGQFAGPPLVAWLVAWQGGSWAPTGWFTASCCLSGLVLSLLLQRRLARAAG